MHIDKKVLDKERVKLLLANNFVTLFNAFFAAIVYFFVFKDYYDHLSLGLVLLPYNIFTILRFFVCKSFWASENKGKISNYASWENRYMTLTLLAGISFGIMTFWCFKPGDLGSQLFCVVMSVGYMAGAATAYSASMKTVLAFAGPAVLFLDLSFLLKGGEAVHWVYFIMALLFFLSSVKGAKKTNEMIQNEVEFRLKSIHSSKVGALAEMAAGMAHEINNPLAIVKGQSGAIRKTFDNPDLAERLDKIEFNVKRIAEIISGLKQYSQDISEQEAVAVSLQEILHKSFVAAAPIAKKINIQVIEDYPEEKLMITCRVFEMKQAFTNIIINGIEAADKSEEKWVKISCRPSAKHVSIWIQDSGPGISHEILSNIMSPFFTTKEVGKGTGLGLSTALGIIEAHDGKLNYLVDKRPTTFQVNLPLNAH